MKKIKKFIASKGGLLSIIGVIATIILAFFFIILGNVYSKYNGDWSYVVELLTNDFAISVYIVLALFIFFGFIIYVKVKSREDY